MKLPVIRSCELVVFAVNFGEDSVDTVLTVEVAFVSPKGLADRHTVIPFVLVNKRSTARRESFFSLISNAHKSGSLGIGA